MKSQLEKKDVSRPLRTCIMHAIYFFSPFPPSGHNGFCVSLLKSSRIWTFSWHLLLRKHWEKGPVYWEQPAVCDTRFAEGLKTIMQTRGFNEMLPSREYNPSCSSSRLPGSSTWGSHWKNDPYTKKFRYADRRLRNEHVEKESRPFFSALSTPPCRKGNLIETSNIVTFPSVKGRWPLLWPGWTAPGERATRDGGLVRFVCVHVSQCVLGSRSRRLPIILLSERAVGRNWRRGPQLSEGLAGGPQWLAAFPRTHTYIYTDVPHGTHRTRPDTQWAPRGTAWTHRTAQRCTLPAALHFEAVAPW